MDTSQYEYYRSVRPDTPGRDPIRELAEYVQRLPGPVYVARSQHAAIVAAGATQAAMMQIGGPLPGEVWIPQ